MFTKDYEWYIRHLTDHAGLRVSEIRFVENIAAWCREHGIDETDKDRPLRIVNRNGYTLLVAKMIPDQIVEERINAARIRSQLRSVSQDPTDLLDTAEKKLAYLFLKELSLNNPELAYDELAADEWIFGQLNRIGITPSVMKSA